jgi:hypothetical protein
MTISNTSVFTTRQTIFLLSGDNTEIAVIQMELFAPPVDSVVVLLHDSQQQSFTVKEVQTVLNPRGESIRVFIKLVPLILVRNLYTEE